MAAKIFADHKLLEAINAVIHPAVKAYILQEIEAEREAGDVYKRQVCMLYTLCCTASSP